MLDEIFTPGYAAILYLKKKGVNRACLLATADLAYEFQDAGIELDLEAETVVVGDSGDEFNWASITKALRSLKKGGELIALEKDQFWMDTDGLAPVAGLIVAGLEYASGVQATLIGKPSKIFFHTALNEIGVKAKKSLMIGDDIRSDIEGAQNAGLIGVQVCTGKFNPADNNSCSVKPDGFMSSIQLLSDFFKIQGWIPKKDKKKIKR